MTDSSLESARETTLDLVDAATRLARDLPISLKRLSLRAGDRTLELEFAPSPADPLTIQMAPPAAPPLLPSSPPAGLPVAAPLVGTFYAAPTPGADPFVKVGDQVDAGQTIGIVEAMKLMNPVTTAVSGTIVEVLVQDGQSVEYDQALLLIRPGA